MAKFIKGGTVLPPLSNLTIIRNILETAFSKDNVDFQKDGDGYTIIIFFPEITVRNDSNRKHVMKEVYVFIEVTSKGIWKVPRFKIYRTRFNQREVNAKYLFSHSNRERYPDFQLSSNPILADAGFNALHTCCVGPGIVNTMTKLASETFDATAWQLFINQLIIYLEYEDLTGGPWVPMARIYSVASAIEVDSNFFNNPTRLFGAFPPTLDLQFKFKVLKTLCNDLIPKLRLSSIISEASAHIVINNSSLEIERILTESAVKHNYLDLLCIKDNKGKYYRRKSNNNFDASGIEEIKIPVNLIFKGNPLSVIIEPVKAEELEKATYAIHPQIRTQLLHTIQFLLNIKFTKLPLFNLHDNELFNNLRTKYINGYSEETNTEVPF